MTKKLIDAHCHLFYKGYLSRRILFHLIELTADLHHFTHNNKKEKHKINLSAAMKRTVRVLGLINSASSEEVLEKLQNHYQGYDVVYVPLSYDLISCFQEQYDQAPQRLAQRKEHAYFEKVKKEMIFLLDKNLHLITRHHLFASLENIYRKVEMLVEREKQAEKEKNGLFDDNNIFFYQLNDLLALKQKYPEMIFPFLYIDPRRMDYFRNFRDLAGRDKPFLGIKLYTPNGYSPLDPNLMEVYAYCEENDVPVTVHNAYGGFSNFVKKLEIKGGFYLDGQVVYHDGWIEFDTDFFASPREAIRERAERLNHPRLWAQVLRRFPRLKLNLAHFGGDSTQWQEEIFSLLVEYPNVYSDLSCQTEAELLHTIRQKYFKRLPHKFLYGSDYYLNMFFIDDFGQYFGNFTKVFTPDEIERLSLDNARRFLFGDKDELFTR